MERAREKGRHPKRGHSRSTGAARQGAGPQAQKSKPPRDLLLHSVIPIHHPNSFSALLRLHNSLSTHFLYSLTYSCTTSLFAPRYDYSRSNLILNIHLNSSCSPWSRPVQFSVRRFDAEGPPTYKLSTSTLFLYGREFLASTSSNIWKRNKSILPSL